MANDAYKLQGLDGGRKVEDGGEFTVNTAGNGSHSRGFQVAKAGTFTYKMLQAYGATPTAEDTYTSSSLEAGVFIGGPITSVSAGGGGEATVFPNGNGFTINS